MAMIDPNAPLDRSKAWSCLTANLLVLPGLGTLMAKRPFGWMQIGMSVVGAILTIIGVIVVGVHWISTQQLSPELGMYAPILFGAMFFCGGWLWSLVTSLTLLKETRQPPVHPGARSR